MNTSSRWFRFNVWLHRWSSLVATLPFLVLCLTGTVLIFHEEIDDAMGVVPTVQADAAHTPQPISQAVANVLAAHPGERVLSIGIDAEHHPGVLLVITGDAVAQSFDGAKLRYADLSTAQAIGDPEASQTTLTGFLLELHAQWFIGLAGELIGALIALLVLLSLLSGLVVYAPYVKRVLFGVLRRGRGPRLLQLDLHNFIGAVVLGWALVVTLTGFLLGFGTVATGIWQMQELSAFRAQAQGQAVDVLQPPVDIDRAMASALTTTEAGWRVLSAIWPGTDFSTPRHYTVLLGGREGLDERLFRAALIDAQDGSVAAARELPVYLKAIVLSEPLHFGDYGGLALKLLWTACTWLTLFITANGAWLWWNRRRKRLPVAAEVLA